jgi:probable HAF family extracellular repeat protein
MCRPFAEGAFAMSICTTIVRSAIAGALVALTGAGSAAELIPHPELPRFDVRMIHPLNRDVPYVAGSAVNDVGQVVGSSWEFEETPVAIITGPNGVGTFELTPGIGFSDAVAINSNGLVVGNATLNHAPAGFSVHADGTGFTFLPPMFAGADTDPRAVNAAGVIVGTSGFENDFRRSYACGPTGEHMHGLGTLGSHDTALTWASDINSAGVVVGAATTWSNHVHAFFASEAAGGMQDLGAGLDGDSGAVAISDNGLIVGWIQRTGDSMRAVITDTERSRLVDIGSLGGGGTNPFDVNSQGWVVGESVTVDGRIHAMLYILAIGQMIDLSESVNLPDGEELARAVAVNESGQIVAHSLLPQGRVATYLLTPRKN